MNKNSFFWVLVIVSLFCSMFLSCGTSTEDLAKQVEEGIFEDYQNDNLWGLPLQVEDHLKLVKKSKTEYTGLMTIGRGPGMKKLNLSVNVLFDGKTIQYEWVER